ncbi:hypothetical protein HanIR_Chr17g0897561 [Helianthus annuus]|nr:hypothetical protein HanIR_Chr17g0897561 [Helianthus annuus]
MIRFVIRQVRLFLSFLFHSNCFIAMIYIVSTTTRRRPVSIHWNSKKMICINSRADPFMIIHFLSSCFF